MDNRNPPENIMDLNELRHQLDVLDTKIIEALSERMALIPFVAQYKQANNIERYQPEREKEVIAHRRMVAGQLSLNPDLVEDIIKRIIEDAHRIEKEIIGS